MFNKTLFAVGITVLLFVGYLFAQYYMFERFEVPTSIISVVEEQKPVERVMLPRVPPQPVERIPGPVDKDPYDETYGSSAMKENLRHPERFFSQAPTPDATSLATESGVAGMPGLTTPQAIQTFSPEYAQNGGEFVDGGIFANDTADSPNFSAF